MPITKVAIVLSWRVQSNRYFLCVPAVPGDDKTRWTWSCTEHTLFVRYFSSCIVGTYLLICFITVYANNNFHFNRTHRHFFAYICDFLEVTFMIRHIIIKEICFAIYIYWCLFVRSSATSDLARLAWNII